MTRAARRTKKKKDRKVPGGGTRLRRKGTKVPPRTPTTSPTAGAVVGGLRGQGALQAQAGKAAAEGAAGANVGKWVGHAGKLGMGAVKYGLPAYGGYLLAQGISRSLGEREDRARKYRALESIPETRPEMVLQRLQDQELLALKRAQLARNDPEAFEILMSLAGGGDMPPELATGEFVLGRKPRGPSPGSEQQIDEILALLG